MNIVYYKRPELNKNVRRRIKVVDAIFDIGCGIRPQVFFKPRLHYCIEPCKEYVDIIRRKYKVNWAETETNNAGMVIINDTIQNMIPLLREHPVDSVFFLDVLEHLSKHEGVAALAWACRVARQQVIINTPLGYREQSNNTGDKDAWGLHGGQWQRHLSGWVPSNFTGEGWEVLVCERYSYLDMGRVYETPLGVMWAIWNNPQASQVKSYAVPSFLTRLQVTDRLIGKWAWLLRILPSGLSDRLLKLSLRLSINADQILRRRRLH